MAEFVTITKDIALKHFSQANIKPAWYQETMSRRLKLLKERAALREEHYRGIPDPSKEYFPGGAEIAEISLSLRVVRRQLSAQFDRAREQDMWEAWRVRDMASVHRIGRRVTFAQRAK